MMYENLRRHLTWTEEAILCRIARLLPIGGRFVAAHLADENGYTRSSVVNALRKAAVAGIIETRSMGAKGTLIVVRDQDAWTRLRSAK